MSEVIYNPDHISEALNIILSQFRVEPRINALVRALVAGIQSLEDDLFNTLVGTPLEIAPSGTLDQWGVILDEPREGLDDNQYRSILVTKLSALRSNGSVHDVLKVWLLLNPQAADAFFTSTYPAAYRLSVTSELAYDDTTRARIIRIIEGVRPAGVLAEYVEGSDDCFTFDEDDLGFDQAPMAERWTL